MWDASLDSETHSEQRKLDAPDIPKTIEAPDEQPRLSSPEDLGRIEAPEEQSKISSPAETMRIEAPEIPAKIEAPEPKAAIGAPEEKPMLESKMNGDVPENDFTIDIIVSVEDAVTLKRVREMKDKKLDFFIDEEISGHTNDDACEDVIQFLKTDISLIDKILGISVTSRSEIERSLKEIIEFVAAAEEPKHQKIYMNRLNQEEKRMEGSYNEVLRRLEQTMSSRFGYLIEESGSVFFDE